MHFLAIHFFIISTGDYWVKNQISTKSFKNVKQCHQLCLISVSWLIKKTSPTGTVIELFSSLHFSVKHWGSVSTTTRQQKYCASNLEQGGVEVRAPSVLRKAKFWNDSRNCWRNAGETLEVILARWTSLQNSHHDLKDIDTVPDASLVLSVLVQL